MALTKLVVELALIDGGSAGVRAFTDRLKTMGVEGEASAKKINEAMTDLQAGLRGLSTSKAMYEGLVRPGVQAAETLQEALTKLEVNLDPGSVAEVSRQLAEVEANAARIAGPTKFDQAGAVQIHTDLRRAGLSMTDITGEGGAAEAVTQLATAEGLSGEQATSAITTLGAIFRLQGDQFGSAADLLARAGSAANTDANQLREALAQASSAGTLGLDPQETLAALGVMANLGIKGGSAGTSLNAFLRQAATNNDKMGLGLFDEGGQFIGLQGAATQLRGLTAGKTDLQVQQALTKAFGDEGARFAGGLLRTGSGGLEEVMANIDGSRSLSSRVGLMAGTKAASDEALAGTVQTTLATLFKPALAPLTSLSQKANDLVGQVGTAAQEDPRIAQAVSLGAMGATAGVALYGAARVARGGGRLLSALRTLPSLGGAGAGLPGVPGAGGGGVPGLGGPTPVAVVNWPPGLGLAGAGGPAAAGASRLASVVPLAAAGVAGYTAGTALNSELSKTELGNAAMEGAVSSALLYTLPGRLMAELSDRMTGGGLVKEAQATRANAINVVVKNLPGGGAEVEVEQDGLIQRAMGRLGMG